MLSQSRRALLALGLMPTLLWWACTATVDLDGLPDVFEDYVTGKNTGRTLVKISED